MVDNPNINVNVQVGNDTEINDSPIANINVNYIRKTLEQLLIEAHKQVAYQINEIEVNGVRRELLRFLDNIKDYFNNNKEVLKEVMEQVNCKLPKSDEKNMLTLNKLLSFLAVASYTNNSITIPDSVFSGIKIRGKKSWIFNAADLSEISLPKHISKIADYIARTPDCSIKDGNCYITMLLRNKRINFCNNCEKGLLSDTHISILHDIMVSNINWQDDFFDLRENKKLVFKCGDCTSNISEFEYAKEILEDI